MVSSKPQLGQVVPFPVNDWKKRDTRRRDLLRQRLNQAFYSKAHAFTQLKFYGLTEPSKAILAPFSAVKQLGGERPCYLRLSTHFPSSSTRGAHELKLVGGDDLSLFIMEVQEKPQELRTANSLDLKRIAERRLEALSSFVDLQPISLTPQVAEAMLRNLIGAREFEDSVLAIRWVAAVEHMESDRPPRIVTLEMTRDDERFLVDYDQYPYTPSDLHYAVSSKAVFAEYGEPVLGLATKAFCSGAAGDFHKLIANDARFRRI